MGPAAGPITSYFGYRYHPILHFTRFHAGLEDIEIVRLPSAWCGRGKDAHLPWQVLVARSAFAVEEKQGSASVVTEGKESKP